MLGHWAWWCMILLQRLIHWHVVQSKLRICHSRSNARLQMHAFIKPCSDTHTALWIGAGGNQPCNMLLDLSMQGLQELCHGRQDVTRGLVHGLVATTPAPGAQLPTMPLPALAVSWPYFAAFSHSFQQGPHRLLGNASQQHRLHTVGTLHLGIHLEELSAATRVACRAALQDGCHTELADANPITFSRCLIPNDLCCQSYQAWHGLHHMFYIIRCHGPKACRGLH